MTSPIPQSPTRTSDDDQLVLIGLAVLAAGAAGSLATVLRARPLAWLLEHRVILPAGQDPLVTLPWTGGAGLDSSRLAIASAVLLVLLAATVGAARRALRRRRELA